MCSAIISVPRCLLLYSSVLKSFRSKKNCTLLSYQEIFRQNRGPVVFATSPGNGPFGVQVHVSVLLHERWAVSLGLFSQSELLRDPLTLPFLSLHWASMKKDTLQSVSLILSSVLGDSMDFHLLGADSNRERSSALSVCSRVFLLRNCCL